jgi:GntR family transcriptional regulator, transcriptional repressor for pyruvate dehydrogenase complex
MPKRNEKIAHSIAREIVSEVVANSLETGTVLESESMMMDRYEVSRGSLREALRILEVLGFIEIKPGPRGGPVLLEPDSRQFSAIATLYYQRIRATYRDLLETRLILEPQAAALAAENRTPEQVERLRTYIDRSHAAEVGDDRQFREVGQGFHDLLAEMAGNGIVNMLIRSCYDVFAGRTSGFIYPPTQRESVQSIHEQIALAVINGNARTAKSLMYDHMEDYVEEATKQFSGLMSEVVAW